MQIRVVLGFFSPTGGKGPTCDLTRGWACLRLHGLSFKKDFRACALERRGVGSTGIWIKLLRALLVYLSKRSWRPERLRGGCGDLWFGIGLPRKRHFLLAKP